MTDKIYNNLVQNIIKSTANAIGPVAVMLANQVKGLTASPYKITIEGNPLKVIDDLLNKYQQIIGSSAITLAKKGIRKLLEKNKKLKVPERLQ